MWIKCTELPSLEGERFLVSKKSCILPGETVFFGYPRGCVAVVQFAIQHKGPRPPKGSYEEQDTLRSWTEAKQKLTKYGWNQKEIQWWKSTIARPKAPPRFIRKKFSVGAEETGKEALARIGVFTYNIPEHTEHWSKQSTLVRRYWRSLFLMLAGLTSELLMPSYDVSRAFDYIRNSVPGLWQSCRKPCLGVPCKEFSDCQMGFFARLFETALRIRRQGLSAVYPADEYELCRAYSKVATDYVKEKYPFIPMKHSLFAAETIADRICEDLWFGSDVGELLFEEFNLARVFLDYADCNPIVYLLEEYTPDTYNELLPKRRKFNALDLRAELMHCGYQWSMIDCERKKSKVFGGRVVSHMLVPCCEPEFLKEAEDMLDVNWIRWPKEVIVPRRLQVLRLSIPALPLVPKNRPSLSELMLSCALDDSFLFSMPQWYEQTSVVHRVLKKWYFNASFYDCKRRRMIERFGAMLKLLTPC